MSKSNKSRVVAKMFSVRKCKNKLNSSVFIDSILRNTDIAITNAQNRIKVKCS